MSGNFIDKSSQQSPFSQLSLVLACRIMQVEKDYPSMGEFAKAAGVSRATLHAIKTGRGNVCLETLEKISSNLNIPVCELFSIPSHVFIKCLKQYGIDPNVINKLSSEFKPKVDQNNGDTALIRTHFSAADIPRRKRD